MEFIEINEHFLDRDYMKDIKFCIVFPRIFLYNWEVRINVNMHVWEFLKFSENNNQFK